MTPLTGAAPDHLLIAPLLIPLIAGALMLFYDDRRRWLKFGIGLAAILLLANVSLSLLDRVGQADGARVYILGNWPVPMGIVLVLDPLSAMMVMLTSILALPTLLYAAAGWQGKGQHFHSLFQFLLFGLNGAFLTGDLFNLFVFFEVMLAASYGLVLHGSGVARIREGMHYIAINLIASLLFLLGVALVYGVTGSLNMAEIGQVSRTLGPDQRPLFHAGAALLAAAFLIKAAAWPMCFWLPRTYAAASAPVAAMLALMSKVGVYALLRGAMLCFGPDAGVSAGFGGWVLSALGLATMVYGAAGLLSVDRLAQRAGYVALISSGTLVAAVGMGLQGGGERLIGGALLYLFGSTMAVSMLYLLAEMVERQAPPDPNAEPATEATRTPEEEIEWGPMGLGAVDDDDEPAMGLPGSLVTVGGIYAATVVILAGLPPFSNFVGKFAMLSGLLASANQSVALWPFLWAFFAILLASGFVTLVSLVRYGIRRFWYDIDDRPRILALEVTPVAILLAGLFLLGVRADEAMRLTLSAARDLLSGGYIHTVMEVRPVDPGVEAPTDAGDAAP